VKRWRDKIAARPAVQKAVQVLADRRRQGPHTDKEREVLFGNQQYAKR
jgi:GST-like protein